MKKCYEIVAWTGDGCGPELVDIAIHVLQEVSDNVQGLNLSFTKHEVGYDYWKKTGSITEMFGMTYGGMTEQTLVESARADAVFYVATTTHLFPAPRVRAPTDLYRKYFEINSAVMLGKSISPVSPKSGIDCAVVRETTEGMYYPEEIQLEDDYVLSIAKASRKTSQRIAKFAFDLASRRNKKRVTCFQKKAMVPGFFNLFLNNVRKVSNEYPQVDFQLINLTELIYQLVTKPQYFDVILTTNFLSGVFFGLIPAIVGGYALVPTWEGGEKQSVFRPVHGTVPDLVGKNRVNPMATLLSTALMLRYLSDKFGDERCRTAAEKLESAINVLPHKGILTPDLGGNATTSGVVEAIVREVAGRN